MHNTTDLYHLKTVTVKGDQQVAWWVKVLDSYMTDRSSSPGPLCGQI